jgi:hypothetical protein
MRVIWIVALAACGGGAEDVEQSSDLFGRWALESGEPAAAAPEVRFDDPGFAFALTTADGEFVNGTYNVQAGEADHLVLLFPVDPPNTTWCSPGATIDGDEVCFEAFDADRCSLTVGRIPVEGPVVGCYTRQ